MAWSNTDEQKLLWYLATAYVADVLGVLDPVKAAKLASFEAAAGTQTWQEHVREALDVDDAFVRRVVEACRARGKDETQSIGFLLRGLGCPDAEERMREVLG